MGSFKVNDSAKKQEDAKRWYSKQNFSSAYIKKFQRVVGTKDDGKIVEFFNVLLAKIKKYRETDCPK